MEVTIRIRMLSLGVFPTPEPDVSRRTLEALALEGYRDQTLTLYEVSEMLGLSRDSNSEIWQRPVGTGLIAALLALKMPVRSNEYHKII